MTSLPVPNPKQVIVYPENDGSTSSDQTLQTRWIRLFKENLEALFANDPYVLIAVDLLWYPIEGNNLKRGAPDVLVAFGCAKGPRGSFREWEEGVAPQVVFEILSPAKRTGEMLNKLLFYDRFGVEEYYLYDPLTFKFIAFVRDTTTGALEQQGVKSGFTSPRLALRFVVNPEAPLAVFGPDGRSFLTFDELALQTEPSEQWAGTAEQRAGSSHQRADAARQRADSTEDRSVARAAKLRSLGIDPDVS